MTPTGSKQSPLIRLHRIRNFGGIRNRIRSADDSFDLLYPFRYCCCCCSCCCCCCCLSGIIPVGPSSFVGFPQKIRLQNPDSPVHMANCTSATASTTINQGMILRRLVMCSFSPPLGIIPPVGRRIDNRENKEFEGLFVDKKVFY